LLCSGDPLCHYYTDNALCRQGCETFSLYSEFQKAKFNRCKIFFLYLLGHLMKKNQRHKNLRQRGTNYLSKNSVQLGQNFQNQLPDNLSGIKTDFRPS